MKRSESRTSLASGSSATNQEMEKTNNETLHSAEPFRARTGSELIIVSFNYWIKFSWNQNSWKILFFFFLDSPADLHGMWYPPVRRTLVTLSRLYRCVERPIFQGLSQEALSMCIQSIASAANTISTQKVNGFSS